MSNPMIQAEQYLVGVDSACARGTGFRNWRVDWSVHLKLSIEKWLLVICPNYRPLGLIPATPTPWPPRANNKFSILNDQCSIGLFPESGVAARFGLVILLASLLASAAPPVKAGTLRTQQIQLHQGWNSIFLEL